MKRGFRVFAFLLAVLLLALLASAADFEPVTLEVWFTEGNEQFEIIRDLVDQYFTPKTGISIKGQVMLYDDLWQKGLLALASGDTPDVASFGSEWPAEFGVRGGLIDLKKEFGEEFDQLIAKVFPNQMRAVEFMGAYFGIPVRFGFAISFYRTDIFEEKGWEYPKTWDEVKVLLPKMAANNMTMSGPNWYLEPNWTTIMQFVWQHGGEEIKADHLTSGLDEPGSIKGFTTLVELFRDYGVPQAPTPINAFATGEMPIMVAGNWNYSALDAAYPNLMGKWTMELIPGAIVDGQLNRYSYNGGVPFGIFANSKHKKEAWEFIKWFFSDEIQIEYSKRVMQKLPHYFFFSANMNAAYQSPFPEEDVKILFAQAEQSIAPRAGLGATIVCRRFMDNAIMRCLLQGEDPEQSIHTAAKESNQELQVKYREFKRFIEAYLQPSS